jgi:quercetin dioxygenase-like cupin family protein
MVERDRASISVDNLEKIAEFFQIHLVHFFTMEREDLLTITRRDEIRQKLNSPAHTPATLISLARNTNARMEPLLVCIAPGKEEPHYRIHDADVLLYVIEGDLLMIGENGEEHELSTGDMAYYVNTIRRRLKNLNEEQPLFVLLITAPPTTSLKELRGVQRGVTMPPEKP